MLGLLLVAVGILLLIQGKIEIIPQANIAFGCAYAFVALIWMIFAKRIDEFRIRKNIRNNRMVAGKKYNIPLSSIECITVIEDDYVETRELGSSTRYLKKDYLRNFEDDKFYILEFTNGRYLFFKKDSFPSKEDFDKLIEEIDKFDS
ncbi:MAG: hypothetical protein J5857_10305 [Treponema sp.]|nr:hypothetical protein [Treponema sp.]